LSGSYGILRGLKKAGANSVIVSLWEVNDLAARLFMSYFFDFLTHGKSKNEAFFAAREKLKNYSGKFKITATKFSQTRQANVTVEKEITVNFNSPYYYSAFILNDGI
jgi:CHAT domain-containing protein